MYKQRWREKFAAMILSSAMVLGMIPLSASALAEGLPIDTSGEVIVLEKLAPEIAAQTVPPGTDESALRLPDKLTAAGLAVNNSGSPDASEPVTMEIPVTWTSAPEYNKDKPGIYTFTAEITGYTLSAEPPVITVSVSDATRTITNLASDSESIDLRPMHYRMTDDGQVETSYDGMNWTTYDNISLAGVIVETDDETYQYLGYTKTGLKAIATLSGYPGVGAVTDGLFGALFGSDTDQILKALDKISKQLDAIQTQMTNMTAFLANEIKVVSIKNALQGRILSYANLVPAYSIASRNFIGTLDQINKLPNETEQEKADKEKTSREFFLNNVNKSMLSGTDFNKAVQVLGENILQIDPINKADLFGAFDKLMLYGYKWEHHGYPYRIAFQAHVMALYTNLAALSMEGLTVGIDEAEKNGNTADKLMMITLRDNLKAQISAVNAMAENHEIVLRPKDQRYYQVPGHELLLKAVAIPRTVNPTYPNFPNRWPNDWIMSYDLFGGVICNGSSSVPGGVFCSKYNPSGYLPIPKDGISGPYPTADWFVNVYNDYGGLKNLYDIFFSEDEGDIDKSGIPDMNANPIPPFTTSDWWKVTPFIVSLDCYYMKLIDKYGKPKEGNDNWLANVITAGNSKDGIRDWNPHMMIGIVVIPQLKSSVPSEMKISGMEESYKAPYSNNILLSVEDKGELYTYEWQADRDGHGFMPIDGAKSTSYALGPVDESMNGYQYRCLIIQHRLDGEAESALTDVVTLNLAATVSNSYTPNYPKPVIPTDKQPNMPTVAKMSVPGMAKDGILYANITEQMVKDAIEATQDAARKSGKEADGIAVEFGITGSGSQDAWPSSAGTARPGLNAIIDAGAIDRLKEAGMKFIKIGSAMLDVTLDTGAIAEIDRQSAGTITVSAAKLERLSDAAKKLIGNRPVFDITVDYQNNGKSEHIADFGKGAVTLGIAYKAAYNEETGSLYGVYVDKNGKPQLLSNSSYDNGRLIFARSSLSTYGVGYKTPAPAFADTAKHWAKDNIDFAASRGLIDGTSEKTFAPDADIIRADFLMALGRLSSTDINGHKTSSFTDVKYSDPVMPNLEWAVNNKIVSGYGNGKFGPSDSITREQMAVMMVNYAKATGYNLPVSHQAAVFADDAKISTWAKEAVKVIQQTGIIVCKTGNLFDPQGNATRGEASTILRRFVELVIDEGTARGWNQNDAGQWQYIGENGKAATGWLDIDSKRYYFTKDGIMISGKWLENDGKWYYFYAEGSLAKSTTVDGYEVDENGARKTR